MSGPTKKTTAPMKREDAMQGSWSVAVYEKHRSLGVDDVVLVGAPTWWRTVAMDRVEDSADGWRRLVWGWLRESWTKGSSGVRPVCHGPD